MFIGSYRHQVDSKGRVAVPAQLRKGLPQGSVVAIGAEGRLVIRPPDEWSAMEQRFRLTADTPAEERRYLRALYASAREVELDGQGRLLLIDEHRRWAGIGDRAVFVGLGNVVEVVGEDTWDRENADLDPAAFTELGDRVAHSAGEAS
ncbi:MAG TPA: division/cell wall cluster transcriptional repressor MraZ [Candidatus Dormibacteraeota bacterium]|nr:division/cell wall cluster transcriptional repressor MraZ [Candidatus Dormibacteraeota bacterium]